MDVDDRLVIETPEGVSIRLVLAGLGSRFGAAVVDLVIQGVVLLLLVLGLTLAGPAVSDELAVFLMGMGTVVLAVLIVGYFVLFETLTARTPGKAAFGLRVATVDGSPLTLTAVTLRTLMRLIDFLPAGYAVGAGAILVTRHNQRLGDLVAGTVVIRDRLSEFTAHREAGGSGSRLGWDTSAVTREETDLVRRFLDRRDDFAEDARQNLAADLAARLRPKVRGGEELDDEAFLDQVLTEKSAP